MVYRKRYYKRRTSRKRNFKRRFRARSRYSKKGQKVFMYTRHCGLSDLVINTSLTTLTAFNFSLNDLPNYTEFTDLYDMYKINAVKITFNPQMNMNNSLTPLNNAIASARFFSAIDYNDSAAPLSVNELREYRTVKYTTILKPHKRMIYKPKILDTSGYSISPWMGTAYPTTNYFGLKVAVEPMESTTITSMRFSIECKYYLSFKNVK